MTAVAFLGPSLDRAAAADLTGAELLPPARQGDLVCAVRRGATRVALVDGSFDGVPAVWHKEILWAAAEGVSVVGGASMGALRAAELAGRGITGVGTVFGLFASGVLYADDEVAVVHAPAEQDFAALSDALVSIRWNVGRAVAAGVLGAEAADRVVAQAVAAPYPERHRRRLAATWGPDLGPAERAALAELVDGDWEDLKRRDAAAVLQALEGPLPPPRALPPVPMTAFFAELLAECAARPKEMAGGRA